MQNFLVHDVADVEQLFRLALNLLFGHLSVQVIQEWLDHACRVGGSNDDPVPIRVPDCIQLHGLVLHALVLINFFLVADQNDFFLFGFDILHLQNDALIRFAAQVAEEVFLLVLQKGLDLFVLQYVEVLLGGLSRFHQDIHSLAPARIAQKQATLNSIHIQIELVPVKYEVLLPLNSPDGRYVLLGIDQDLIRNDCDSQVSLDIAQHRVVALKGRHIDDDTVRRSVQALENRPAFLALRLLLSRCSIENPDWLVVSEDIRHGVLLHH